MAETLTLKECAERLGVHYMTAYRYIRHGRLAATKGNGEWQVAAADLEALLSGEAAPVERGDVDWSARLEDRLMAGDGTGAWSVIEAALASGLTPEDVHVDLIGESLQRIGHGWHIGAVSIAEEHRATAIATKLVGRLSPRFSRRGRRRGKVVIGTAPGETHSLTVAIVADLLRGASWDVVELGADLPIDEFVAAVEKAMPIAAIAVSVSNRDCLDATADLISSLQASVVAPVVVGGPAVDATSAAHVGADGWASDGRTAVDAIAALTARGAASN